MSEDYPRCPGCRTDLSYGGTHVFATVRVIPVQCSGFDGVLFWRCPDCGHEWHRWGYGSSLHRLAQQHMKEGS